MGVTIRDVRRMLEDFSGKRGRMRFLEKRNEELRQMLKSMPEGESKKEAELEIRATAHALTWRIRDQSVILRLMEKHLTGDEQRVLCLRHMEQMQWDMISLRTGMARSSCIRAENSGIEKLRDAWEAHLAGKEKDEG